MANFKEIETGDLVKVTCAAIQNHSVYHATYNEVDRTITLRSIDGNVDENIKTIELQIFKSATKP